MNIKHIYIGDNEFKQCVYSVQGVDLLGKLSKEVEMRNEEKLTTLNTKVSLIYEWFIFHPLKLR